MKEKKLIIFTSLSLIALIIIGSILGALLRLINEIRYTLEYILPYWLVTPVIFTGVILFILLAGQFGFPLLKKLSRKDRKDKNNYTNSNRINIRSSNEAAKQSLAGIDQILQRLQSTLQSESLKKERERINTELSRGDLLVVVFGTGSSGKTSLIRALLNSIVGNVDAKMGSTPKSQKYRLRLKGLNRGIQLIDTPGILEGGKEGRQREIEARKQASRADLLILVVDSDLTSSELEAIQSLHKLGKKLLLILNKCDLRGREEENKLLQLLRSRCTELIKPENIIPTSTAPQSLPRPGKKPWQPPPEIDLFLKQFAQILYNDGEELLADNILLQCSNLGEQGKILLSEQRRKEANNRIDRFGWIGGSVVAANPLPGGVDLLATAAVNAQMVMEIAKIYGVEITTGKSQELAISVGRTLAGVGIVKGGITLINSALNISIPTLIISRAIQGISTAWLTRIAGASFITYFEQDQDWGDGGIQEVVQRHYELNKREASFNNFLRSAIERVVEPLQKGKNPELPPRLARKKEEEEGPSNPK